MAQIKDLISNGIIQDIFSNSRFCCLRCFEEAMKSYHRIESKIDVNQLFYNDDVDTTQMSGCLSLAYRHRIYIRTAFRAYCLFCWIGLHWFTVVNRGTFCQFLFWWIYYCHSSKSAGKETGKTHLCVVCDQILVSVLETETQLFYPKLKLFFTSLGDINFRNLKLDTDLQKWIEILNIWQ